jgi:cytosine deaminase
MNPFAADRWPAELPPRYWLADATVPAALRPAGLPARLALRVDGAHIGAVQPRAGDDAPVFALDGATVLSAFVDAHTHLDKGDLLAAGLAPERELFAAVERVRADYARWSEGELRARIGFGLRCAFAHGTRALNSYCDWSEPEGPLAWRVLQALRREWAGRIELTLTSLLAIDELADAARGETMARALAAGGGVFGLFVYPGAPVELLPRAFDLAERFDLRLDFHVDEHLHPPAANLGAIARLARARGWGSRTVCGHACVLCALPEGERDALLDEVAASGMALVTLPLTNLYLQDSTASGPRRTPRRRGLLPVHEARARGVAVAIASDNHRDPFFPGGDLDPLQALALGALALQLDAPVEDWADTITATPARLLHLDWDGVLRAGAPADLVLHPGRCSAEVLSRSGHGRQLVRAGRRVQPVLPEPRELDNLRH